MTRAGDTLDADTVEELRRLDADSPGASFLAQLIQLFRENAPGRLARIRAAIADRDAETLEHVAHTLKSNCSMLGALRMADYCHDLEEMGGQRNFESAAALLPAADDEFERVVKAVDTLLPPDRNAEP